MKNLLECDGKRFTCKIAGTEVSGVIAVEFNEVYLCQNAVQGLPCINQRGYKYSWAVCDGELGNLAFYKVTDFQLRSSTQSELDSYKDWQVGDKVTDGSVILSVIFRSGELVVLKGPEGCASGNYTCDELYASGYRLVYDDEDALTADVSDVVEVTLEEIAAWKGVSADRIRIVGLKEE